MASVDCTTTEIEVTIQFQLELEIDKNFNFFLSLYISKVEIKKVVAIKRIHESIPIKYHMIYFIIIYKLCLLFKKIVARQLCRQTDFTVIFVAY